MKRKLITMTQICQHQPDLEHLSWGDPQAAEIRYIGNSCSHFSELFFSLAEKMKCEVSQLAVGHYPTACCIIVLLTNKLAVQYSFTYR